VYINTNLLITNQVYINTNYTNNIAALHHNCYYWPPAKWHGI